MLFILKDEGRKRACMDFIQQCQANGKTAIDVGEYKATRSKAQNRLMWKWFEVFREWMGYAEKEDVHDLFCVRFLGLEEREIDGKQITRPKGTRNLKVNEFAEFLTKIEATAAEMGIQLPIPDDYAYAMAGYHPINKGENK